MYQQRKMNWRPFYKEDSRGGPVVPLTDGVKAIQVNDTTLVPEPETGTVDLSAALNAAYVPVIPTPVKSIKLGDAESTPEATQGAADITAMLDARYTPLKATAPVIIDGPNTTILNDVNIGTDYKLDKFKYLNIHLTSSLWGKTMLYDSFIVEYPMAAGKEIVPADEAHALLSGLSVIRDPTTAQPRINAADPRASTLGAVMMDGDDDPAVRGVSCNALLACLVAAVQDLNRRVAPLAE